MLYLISYDLNKLEQSYTKLIARLKELGAERVLRSQWFLVSGQSAKAIADDIETLMDQNDRLLVNELRHNTSWNNLMVPSPRVDALITKNARP